MKIKEIINCNLISIHALCEEGDDDKAYQDILNMLISIHALCEEGDQ